MLPYRPGEENQELSKVLTDVFRHNAIGQTVVLWAGTEPVEQAPIANCEITVCDANSWKAEVRRQFDRVLHKHDSAAPTLPPGGAKWVEDELAGLSNALYPTQADIIRVQRVASSFSISDGARSIARSRRLRRRFRSVSWGPTLALQSAVQGSAWRAELIRYFERDDWNVGLPEPTAEGAGRIKNQSLRPQKSSARCEIADRFQPWQR
jgi:hypothetical protein